MSVPVKHNCQADFLARLLRIHLAIPGSVENSPSFSLGLAFL